MTLIVVKTQGLLEIDVVLVGVGVGMLMVYVLVLKLPVRVIVGSETSGVEVLVMNNVLVYVGHCDGGEVVQPVGEYVVGAQSPRS